MDDDALLALAIDLTERAGAAILAIVAIGLWVSGRFGGLCDILDGKGSTGTAGTFGTCVKGTGVGT